MRRASSKATGKRPRRAVRRVAVVTGSRAEYGLLRSTMEAIQEHPSLRLQLVATGMHLIRKCGNTVRDILRDGWTIDAKVPMQCGDDDPLDQAMGLSRGIAGIARFIREAKTDIVVVLGDRIEAFAGALAAVTTGRFVAHIHAGDVAPGDFDNSIRYAVTKVAHLHLTATEAARKRVIAMGEQRRRVHCVGAPGLDRLTTLKPRHNDDTPRTRQALIVQHPCGRSPTRERKVMRAVLRAVADAGLARTIIYPNTDRGHSGIIEAIETHRRNAPNGSVRAVRSLAHDEYLRLLLAADVLIGNSSSGLIEAPAASTPVVNVGDRQHGRDREPDYVWDAEESPASIRNALRRALAVRPITGTRRLYGDGRAGQRIAKLLARMPLDEPFRRKP